MTFKIAQLLFLFGFVSTVSMADSRFPDPEIDVLPNGLKVVWFKDQRIPTVETTFLFPFGNRNDEVGKSGQSELLAALLDRGAARRSAKEIQTEIENLGASRQMVAAEDGFSVGAYGFVQDSDRILEILADIIMRPNFSDSEIQSEKAKFIDRLSHVGDSADSLAGIVAHRLVTRGTPYGRGSVLSIGELSKIKRDDLIRFQKRFLVPNHAVLAVVGRFDRPAMRRKITSLFSDWKPSEGATTRSIEKFSDPRLSRITAKDLVLIDRPGLSQAEIRMVHLGPNPHSKRKYALIVGNALLGEYFNSRLNRIIRDQLALTYGISSQMIYTLDQGRFRIATSSRNEKVGQIIKKTLEIVKLVVSGDISEDELNTAKEYLLGSFPLGMSTLSAVANRWVNGYFSGFGPDYLNEFVPNVKAVTYSSLLEAMKSEIKPDQFMIVISGDAKTIKPILEKDGFKSIKQLQAKDLL